MIKGEGVEKEEKASFGNWSDKIPLQSWMDFKNIFFAQNKCLICLGFYNLWGRVTGTSNMLVIFRIFQIIEHLWPNKF